MFSSARISRPTAWSGRTRLIACGLLLFFGARAFANSSAPVPGLVEEKLAPRSGPRGATLFTELPSGQTGIVTTNNYDDPKMWRELNEEFESGAIGTGVAIGDYDGDGKPDLFVVSKTESCRLFRNLGNWKFEDVTAKAGVEDRGAAAKIWKQGATFADVNNDGLLDIYVCRFNAPNLLYINQGDGTFKEMAHAYGLDVKDASVMAAFCDYDRDGWLDVFIQTNVLNSNEHPNGQKNYLFHNNRDGTFTNVTDRAGISGEAQGHSAVWWDFNQDGWPDLYVCNDFSTPDKLYRNNRDGTFTNVINDVIPHMPFSSMGADLGDVNNDGLIDLFTTDMAASTREKDQRGMADTRMRTVEDDKNPEVAPQYERNALYLNTGTGRCLEAAYLAGIATTDWTWAPRFEDLDNDGRLDLFVTNGMHREATNSDLLARQLTTSNAAERIKIMHDSPVLVEKHFAFRNLGHLKFEDVSAAWGLNQTSVGFGAAFGDFDGDGDLDLVYANYQKGVTVLRNDSDTGHRAMIALRGVTSNRFGIGSTVRIETASGVQVRQLVLARGVLSSSEPIVHFGLGQDELIKRLTVIWPNGRAQFFENLAVDRKFTITEPAGNYSPIDVPSPVQTRPQFEEVGQALGLAYRAREDAVDETSLQPTLPIRLNRRGPAIAVGTIDAAGNEAIVIGGTTLDPRRIMVRNPRSGQFTSVSGPATAASTSVDDGPLLLFDANGDGVNDLLVTKGGNALFAGASEYQPQLFLNDGLGNFQSAPPDTLPSLPISVGAVAAADFNRDGQLDLFIGGRVLPGQYPLPPRSALLANQGGKFVDVTDSVAPGLRAVGMVTSALWSDVDGDGWLDLLVTLDWGQVKYFHNNQGKTFDDRTEQAGFAAAGSGWWTSIASGDFNGDGKPDYVVGNLGLNTQYHADPIHPALLFYGDFKGTGEEPQLVEAYYEGDRLYPWGTRKSLGRFIPSILKRYPKNNLYARATLGEILGEDKLAAAQRFAATELRSGVFLSQPDGTYRFEPLPRLAQISPLQGLVAGDFDGDGHPDIYAAQNSYAPLPAVGRFDGGLSQLLRGDGHGHFVPVPPAESGLIIPGDGKAVAVLDLNHDGRPDFLVTRNNATSLAFRNSGSAKAGRNFFSISLIGSSGNPSAIGARITVEFADGTTLSCEITAGSGYGSQSEATGFFGYLDANPPVRADVRWPSGDSTSQALSAHSSHFSFSESK
ncbi:MAG: FG-GAP-like repeat-containing protein [Lacunisphaera sp.]